MARPLPLLALAASALLSLPACDSLGLGETSHVTPDANLCAGWLPTASACPEDHCPPEGGCTLETCDPATGEGVLAFCEAAPAEISGPWVLRTSLDGDDPCPEITRVDDIDLRVLPGPSGTTAAILAPDGSLLDSAEVSLQLGQTEVWFTLRPTWAGPEGAEVPARLDFDVTVSRTGSIYGSASATAVSGDASCTYAFSVSGERG